MSKGKIYLINEKTNQLVEYQESGYLAEAYLQGFIQNYPDLLAGDQVNPDDPRRWLLISREMGVPGEQGEGSRWSLDHLFIDQDGIPTFVECKRSEDTRIRREVVAQMLDYAANGSEYWHMDHIRQAAAETARDRGRALDEDILELIGEEAEGDIESFWSRVEDNLRRHKVRLLFVADQAPRELRRLVEFLNEEMSNVEVLIVEVRQYMNTEDDSEKALVPRVLGMTEAARAAKSTTQKPRRFTNREEMLTKCTPAAQYLFSRVLDLAVSEGFVVYWGVLGCSIRGKLKEKPGVVSFVYCYPPNKFEFHFHNASLFDRSRDSEFRRELLGFGLFSETGDYTLTSYIEPENKAEHIKLYKHILNRVQAFERQFHPELEP